MGGDSCKLHQVVQDFRRRDSDRPLTVTVPPSFAGTWLVPRLTEFRRLHPDIEVRIDATNRVVDLLSEDADVGIRYGSGNYTGLRTDRLLDEQAFPVCSPRLLAGDLPLAVPGDLRHHTLLHVESDEFVKKIVTYDEAAFVFLALSIIRLGFRFCVV